MVPGMFERERRAAELRRQDWLTEAGRRRPLVDDQRSRPRSPDPLAGLCSIPLLAALLRPGRALTAWSHAKPLVARR